MEDFRALPPDLPVPEDDGAADHLLGADVPEVKLRAAFGDEVDLATIAKQHTLVLYVYPRTGTPGEPSPPGWEQIPGARGCTVQNLAFREHHVELQDRGADIVGVSAQHLGELREFAVRERMPYPLVADSELRLADAMRLPTFEFEGTTLYKRLTLIAQEGQIREVIYPVFPPGSDAERVVELLRD